ncbi:hypothetical protein [Bosea sp. 685]|uniref:hypothetical protein n=1 Tax=Bosea sp. 685 TaxID=3080057 RepID=UPI002892B3F9|nr:hypothetical protein [Bosea sp. 685]WNJ91779.1 hypothetical protein RMR04_05590 [Bosea sp. 685]
MTADEAQKELLAAIGLAVVQTQTTERMMNLAFTYILDLGPTMTLEKLLNLRNKKMTLGQMIDGIQKYVDLNDDFLAVLDEFLDKRNSVIHRFQTIEGISFSSPSGVIAGLDYVERLLSLNKIVLRVLKSLAVHWAAANPDVPQMEFEAEIPEEALHLIFFKKDLR